MQKYLVALILTGLGHFSYAQTWAEWFKQKSTQKKYLIQQIAMLQVYMGYLEKGYAIAKEGLTTIGNIKNEHFVLDKDFFASLHAVNPKVKGYSKVADIIALNKEISKISERLSVFVKNDPSSNAGDAEYIASICGKLNDECGGLTDYLISVVSSDTFQMSDDERIKEIDSIYAEMSERYQFARAFETQFKILSLQHKKEQSEVMMLRRLKSISN